MQSRLEKGREEIKKGNKEIRKGRWLFHQKLAWYQWDGEEISGNQRGPGNITINTRGLGNCIFTQGKGRLRLHPDSVSWILMAAMLNVSLCILCMASIKWGANVLPPNPDPFLWEQEVKRVGHGEFLPELPIYYVAAASSEQTLWSKYRNSFKQNMIVLEIISNFK